MDLNVDVALAHPYDPDAFLDVTAPGWEQRLGRHKTARVAKAPG